MPAAQTIDQMKAEALTARLDAARAEGRAEGEATGFVRGIAAAATRASRRAGEQERHAAALGRTHSRHAFAAQQLTSVADEIRKLVPRRR